MTRRNPLATALLVVGLAAAIATQVFPVMVNDGGTWYSGLLALSTLFSGAAMTIGEYWILGMLPLVVAVLASISFLVLLFRPGGRAWLAVLGAILMLVGVAQTLALRSLGEPFGPTVWAFVVAGAASLGAGLVSATRPVLRA